MKRLITVLLAIILLLPAALTAAEQAADLLPAYAKTGISPEDAKAILGEPAHSFDLGNGVTDIEYEDITFAGWQTNLGLIFRDNRLAMTGYYGFRGLAAEDFISVKEQLSAAYGTPGDLTPETVVRLFTEMSGSETPFIFSDPSAWEADENTAAWAFLVSQDDETQIYVIYVSTEYLRSIGIGEPEAGAVDIEGTWLLTDARSDTASEAEIRQAKEMLASGQVTQTFTFRDGRVTATMHAPVLDIDETQSGTYRISGNLITVISDGQTESGEAVTFSVDGDTLEMTSGDVILVFTRQE